MVGAESGAALPPIHHVVAIPFPGRGHVNPILCFCRLLAARGLAVTVVLTEEWVGLLGAAPATAAVAPPTAGEVTLLSIPNVLPSEHIRASCHPEFMDAVFTVMAAPVERLLLSIPPPAPVAIVADVFLPWAHNVGAKLGVPVCALSPVSAAFFHLRVQRFLLTCSPAPLAAVDPSAAQLSSSQRTSELVNEAFLAAATKARCIIFTSFNELERGVFDSLRRALSCPVYAIGPAIPHTGVAARPPAAGSAWLDAQPPESVLYVSLGSFMSLPPTQLEEIAAGLAASRVRLFWVARDASALVKEIVDDGNSSMVVPWCEDQLAVLRHRAVGGFLTHCGWNSTLEAVFAGVPVLALPLGLDQVLNGQLLVGEWKIGLNLAGGQVRQRGGVRKEEVADKVRRLMEVDGEEGKEMRRRAKEMSEAARRAVGEGGSSHSDVSAFVESFFSRH